MYNCEECEEKTNRLFLDERDPPLNDYPCLCKNCYINSIHDVISEKEDEINYLREKLDKVN